MRKLFFIFTVCVSITTSIAQNFNWNQYIQQDYPTGIAFDNNDTMWYIVQGTGLFEKSGSSLVDHSSGLVTTNIVSVSYDGSNIWVSGYGGVSMFDGTNYTNYDISTYFDDYGILDIDSKNEVWVVQEGYGASFFNGSNWTDYTSADGILGNYFTGLCKNQAGHIFVISSDYNNNKGFVNVFDGTNWTTYDSTSSMIVTYPSSVYCDASNNIWVGGDNALAKFDGTNWTTVVTRPENDNVEIVSITEDASGNIWFAEKNGGGIYYYNGSAVVNTNAPENFCGKAKGIVGDSNGNVFVCLNSGIYKVDVVTSVNTITDNEASIYPNPFNSEINIDLKNKQDIVDVKITTISGKEIISNVYCNANHISINLDKLEKGIYFLNVNNHIKKIIKD